MEAKQVAYNTFNLSHTDHDADSAEYMGRRYKCCPVFELCCCSCCSPCALMCGCYDGCIHVGCRASFRACTACGDPQICNLFSRSVASNASLLKKHQMGFCYPLPEEQDPDTVNCLLDVNSCCLYPATAFGCIIGFPIGLCYGGVAAPRNSCSTKQDLNIYDADNIFDDCMGQASFLDEYAIN